MNNKPDSKVEVKACPFCEVNLILKEDDHGGIWYEHPDRQPYQIFTYKTNHQKGKECVLSNFTLYPEEIKRWNNRPIANNGVSRDEIKNIVDKSTIGYAAFKCFQSMADRGDGGLETYEAHSNKLTNDILAKLQPTAPRGAGEERS